MTLPAPEPASRPDPPEGANNLVVVVYDSLRYDTCAEATTPTLDRLGPLEERWSYASWTAPSHYNLLMGLMPHASPRHVYASEYYKADYLRYRERLGIDGIEFASVLPQIWMPTFLRDTLGYRTVAHVSMPVLNPRTPVNLGFDHYTLMPRHNDMAAIVERLRFDTDRPTFHLLNIGETHYPYALPDEDPETWPRISGVHGVVKRLDGDTAEDEAPAFFDDTQLAELRARQVRAATHVDRVLADLVDALPDDTWLIVTSDHGELFGEGGFFGHGPINHEAVLRVPFVEAKVR